MHAVLYQASRIVQDKELDNPIPAFKASKIEIFVVDSTAMIEGYH